MNPPFVSDVAVGLLFLLLSPTPLIPCSHCVPLTFSPPPPSLPSPCSLCLLFPHLSFYLCSTPICQPPWLSTNSLPPRPLIFLFRCAPSWKLHPREAVPCTCPTHLSGLGGQAQPQGTKLVLPTHGSSRSHCDYASDLSNPKCFCLCFPRYWRVHLMLASV